MKRKQLIWLLVIIILVGIGGLWYSRHRAEDEPHYQTTPATRGELTQVVTATGQLNPVVNVQVGCQISGTIAKLYADYNSQVTNRQVIAQIDPAIYQANLHQAEGDLANTKAALELAQVNATRSQKLFNDKLIPQSDLDQATATLHQAQATVQLKEAALEKAKVDLEHCTIYSPVDGIVISRNVDVGQTVAASLSAPTLFVIANDLTKMQIDANVAEADIGGVAMDQNVDFTVDAFPYRTFHGKVVQVRNSPITVQNVVTYDTVIGVSNPDLKLRPGMTANVSIIIAHRDNALKIPNAALRFRPATGETARASHKRAGGSEHQAGPHSAKRTIYILKIADATTPEAVTITTGITDGISTEVIDGLKENDLVITGMALPQSAGSQTTNPFVPSHRF